MRGRIVLGSCFSCSGEHLVLLLGSSKTLFLGATSKVSFDDLAAGVISSTNTTSIFLFVWSNLTITTYMLCEETKQTKQIIQTWNETWNGEKETTRAISTVTDVWLRSTHPQWMFGWVCVPMSEESVKQQPPTFFFFAPQPSLMSDRGALNSQWPGTKWPMDWYWPTDHRQRVEDPWVKVHKLRCARMWFAAVDWNQDRRQPSHHERNLFLVNHYAD